MSTTDTRLPLAEAAALAMELATCLTPACERIEVAGSIRRQRADVGDLEIIAIPRYRHDTDLFGDATGQRTNLLEERIAWMLSHRELAPRLTESGLQRLGGKYKALTYCGVAVDLFIVLDPACWGVIYTIRTGPADFSHRLVTPRQQGGLLPNHLRVRAGRLVGTDGQPLDTPTEESVFAAIGLDYIAPPLRR